MKTLKPLTAPKLPFFFLPEASEMTFAHWLGAGGDIEAGRWGGHSAGDSLGFRVYGL